MRILHVATSVDGDARSPGSLSTVVPQCAGLTARGHAVEFVLGWWGRGQAPVALDGVPVTGVRLGGADRRRVGGPGARAFLTQVRQAAAGCSVAHLHGLADPLLAGAAAVLRRAGVPYVVQPGPVPPSLPRAGTWERLTGRDPVVRLLAGARRTLGPDPERLTALLGALGTEAPASQVAHGVRVGRVTGAGGSGADAGRDTPPGRLDVVLMAPLSTDRPVAAFAQAAARLIEEGVAADFCVAGPDSGARPELLLFIGSRPHLADHLRYEGRLGYDAAVRRLRAADVFVATGPDDAAPVGLREALGAGLPVLPTSPAVAALAGLADDAPAAGPTAPAMLAALRRMVQDAQLRRRLGQRSLEVAERSFGVTAAVDQLEAVYAEVHRTTIDLREGGSQVPLPRHGDPSGRHRRPMLHHTPTPHP